MLNTMLNIFAKGYTPNWSEENFVISIIKTTVPWTYVINDLNSEEIVGSFHEKELQKNAPVVLSKLSDLVKNVVKKTVYDKLAAKVNNIDTSRFVLKTKYLTAKAELEKKIPDTSGLVKKL